MSARRGTAKAAGRLAAIGDLLTGRKKLLQQIGILMVAESQAAFKAQAFGKYQWPKRGKINTAGILGDFAQGRNKPPKRRFERTPALIDTGALRQSIAFKVTGQTVKVGSALRYASLHQSGGMSEGIAVTKDMQLRLGKWLKRQATDIRAKLGWLLGKKARSEKIKFKVPKRPFVGFTPKTKVTVQKALGVTISKAR